MLQESEPLRLEVAPEAPAAPVDQTVPVSAQVIDAEPPIEILLFVEDGRLAMLECVVYGDERLEEFPLPEDLDVHSLPSTMSLLGRLATAH
jgi:hypothetical protein